MFYQYNHLGSPDYLKIEKGVNFSFPSHLHQCFEIIIITSGQMKITVDGKSFVVKKGEALLIFPNQIHSLESSSSEHLLCIFSPRIVQAYMVKVADKIPVNNKFSPSNYLIDSLDELEHSKSPMERKGTLYSLCGVFDKNAKYKEKKQDGERLLHKIFSFVEEYYNKECTLLKLADIIGYDYSYISRYFKKTVGISFNTYVTNYRISNACYLMENTKLPIIRCAFESGFTSLRSFNRCFKENLNTTPTQYRKDKKLT